MAISQAVDLSTQGRDRNGSTCRVFPEIFLGSVADADRPEPKA